MIIFLAQILYNVADIIATIMLNAAKKSILFFIETDAD